MQSTEWMNEQVKGRIEDLRQNYGFEEAEALAFWHLQDAQELITLLRAEDFDRESEKSSFGASDAIMWASSSEANVFQHFEALYRELALRVHARNYPAGWGRETSDEDEEG